jgi:two-component system, sensor histidine kinase and response regulator
MNYVLMISSDNTLATAVETAGFSPIQSAKPLEIIEMAQDIEAIAVIVDLREALEAGLDAITLCQNYPTTAGYPILAIAPPEARLEALQNGATEFLTPPLDPLEIRTRLRTMIALNRVQNHSRDDYHITEQRLMGIIDVLEHDLRSPVGIAFSSLDLMREIMSDEPDLPPTIFQLLDNTIVAMRRQLFLIQDMIDWMRVIGGRYDYTATTIDVSEQVERGLQKGRELADQNGVAVQVDLPRNLPTPLGDPILFERVINAAVDCALKFCMKGNTIQIRAYEDSNGVAVTISDNGKLIKEQFRGNRLFELERQSEARHVGSRSSVAVGLPFCKVAVQRMNGNIELVSEDNPDITSLKIWLPL